MTCVAFSLVSSLLEFRFRKKRERKIIIVTNRPSKTLLWKERKKERKMCTPMSIPGSRFYPIVVQRVVLCSTRADYRERTEANSFCNDRCLLTFPFDQQPRLLRDRREIRICIYKPPVRDLARPKKCMKKSQSGVTRRRTSLFSKIRSAANSRERFTKLVERIPISTSTLGTEREFSRSRRKNV